MPARFVSLGCPRGARPTSLLTAFALTGFTALASAQKSASAEMYELTLIYGAPGASGSEARSVNALGRVTGNSLSPFVWTRTTGRVDLAPIAGFSAAHSMDVNRSGFVIGTSERGGIHQATLWSPTGAPLALSIPGANRSYGLALNNAGVVLGQARSTPYPWFYFVWDAANGARDLATFGMPAGCVPQALNRADQIAGTEPPGQAFLLDLATSTLIRLGALDGGTSFATGLSDAGHVVGWSSGALNPVDQPFLWTPSGGMRNLGSLAASASTGYAYSVNDSDLVVGSSEIAPGRPHAFLWDEVHGMRDLNALVHHRGPYELIWGIRISNSGWIVGRAEDTSVGNASLAFVLKPL